MRNILTECSVRKNRAFAAAGEPMSATGLALLQLLRDVTTKLIVRDSPPHPPSAPRSSAAWLRGLLARLRRVRLGVRVLRRSVRDGPRFLAAASSLGAELARREARLVYGGVGLMGEVPPPRTRRREGPRGHPSPSSPWRSPARASARSGSSRTCTSARRSWRGIDAFVALPGGFGAGGAPRGDHVAAAPVPRQARGGAEHRGVLRRVPRVPGPRGGTGSSARREDPRPRAPPRRSWTRWRNARRALASRAGPPGASEGKARLI